MGVFAEQFSEIVCSRCKIASRENGSYCLECKNIFNKEYRDRIRNRRVASVSSSSLILGPYKEPLTRFDEGFGYMGALTFDVEGKIQCHICGALVDHLAQHAKKLHSLSSSEYKEKFDLKRSAALISERIREERKAHGLRVWLSKSPEEKEALKELMRANGRTGRKRFQGASLEYKNLRGICPDQLLETIKISAEYYGRTPTMSEYEEFHGTQRFIGPMRKTFGSWNKAVEKAGLMKHERIQGERTRIDYSDEELLELLGDYAHINKVTPMRSDFRRGLLPDLQTYIDRFGSIMEARKLAGIIEYGDGRLKGVTGKKMWQEQQDRRITRLTGKEPSNVVKIEKER